MTIRGTGVLSTVIVIVVIPAKLVLRESGGAGIHCQILSNRI
jgi:hypothetical protein